MPQVIQLMMLEQDLGLVLQIPYLLLFSLLHLHIRWAFFPMHTFAQGHTLSLMASCCPRSPKAVDLEQRLLQPPKQGWTQSSTVRSSGSSKR